MENIIFEQSPNIFSNGMHLVGSNRMSANLNHTMKRLCSICKNDMGKNNCKLLGKIKNPNCPYCSWWRAI